MSIVETYYLIDFENVHEDGLSGSENLGKHDHVHLFSTKNAPKISIEKLTNFNSVDLSFHEISVGNQSLDMHLVSYLGYLIGINVNNKFKYVIISNDSDYDNIISFWKNQNKSLVIRQNKISNLSNTQNQAKQRTSSDDKTNRSSTNNTDFLKKKTQLNSNIQRAVSSAGYSAPTSNRVASIVVKHYGEDKVLSNVHNELRNSYSDYLNLYNIIKPLITQFLPSSTKNTVNPSNQNEIQQTLSKAGFDNNIILYITNVISKHHNEKNIKNTIYKSLVAKYGQNQGLNIYNHIKKNYNIYP